MTEAMSSGKKQIVPVRKSGNRGIVTVVYFFLNKHPPAAPELLLVGTKAVFISQI